MKVRTRAAAYIAAVMLACAAMPAFAQAADTDAAATDAAATDVGGDPQMGRFVDYMMEMTQIQRTLDVTLKQRLAEDAEVAAMSEGFRFDITPIAQAIAAGLESKITQEDLAECIAFIDSPEGASVQALSRSSDGLDAFTQRLETLPAEQHPKVLAFFNASCTARFTQYLGSDETQDRIRAITQVAVCDHLRAKGNKQALERLGASGYCKG